ncbi:MAG: M28 family peptidase [Gemmatimonadales bacterium]
MPSAREVIAGVVALPREAGTPEAAAARALLAAHLAGLGYRLEEQRFGFPPSSLAAYPILGAGLGWLALLEFPLLTLPSVPSWSALAAWLAGLTALSCLTLGLGMGWTPPGTDLREDANLIATRGGGPIRRWIVAHSDTKAQGHSMAGRLVAVWVILLSTVTVSALVVSRLAGPLSLWGAGGGVGLTLLAGVLAGRGGLKGRSPGARDNGTGLLAALVAAEQSRDPTVGILITGAEEFGLVGARVFARRLGSGLTGVEVVNLDTLDDAGPLYVVTHDRRSDRLAERLAGRLAPGGRSVRRRRLPLGILVDSLPLARAGSLAVTVSRLNWGSLRVMHTPGDTPDRLSWETAELVGRAVAADLED